MRGLGRAVGPQARAVWGRGDEGRSSALRGLQGMGGCVWLMLGRETAAATCLRSSRVGLCSRAGCFGTTRSF